MAGRPPVCCHGSRPVVRPEGGVLMERIEGSVLAGGRVVAPAVTAWVQYTTAPNGRPAWCGHFDLPGGIDLTSGGYEFRAADGRAGRVRVLWCLAGPDHPTRAEFRGAGPLRSGRATADQKS